MIRALHWLLSRRYVKGGRIGPRPPGQYIPVTLVPGETGWCDTCQHNTQTQIHALSDNAVYTIGTHCPNCLPQEDHE